MAALKASPGKDIWLFGGGALFRSLAEAKMDDTVEVSIVPVLLGAGIAVAPGLAQLIKLSLQKHRIYRSGIVSLEYKMA